MGLSLVKHKLIKRKRKKSKSAVVNPIEQPRTVSTRPFASPAGVSFSQGHAKVRSSVLWRTLELRIKWRAVNDGNILERAIRI